MIKIAVFVLSTLCIVVDSYTYDVKVLSTPKSSERGLEPCVRQCLGSTGENTTWCGNSDYAYMSTSTHQTADFCPVHPLTYLQLWFKVVVVSLWISE